MTYYDRILLKLRRKYSKDETIGLLFDKFSSQEIEIGKLKSHIAELEYKLEELETFKISKNRYREQYLRSIQDEYINKLRQKIKGLKSENKKLETDKSNLITKVVQLQI